MAVSTTPVLAGAAIKGPPPPAPSIERKAICLPSCDQRGDAAYPFSWLSFRGLEPSAFTDQSCLCSFSPAVERRATVLESGDQAGSASILSPVASRLTNVGDELPDVA